MWWLNFFYASLFLLGIYYLIRYRLNLKKAAEVSHEAIFPQTKTEFSRILLPTEWKEMEPLTKETKSYQYVHWGTIAALAVLVALMVIVMTTDWLGTSFFSIAYILFTIINVIPHRRNLFILTEGLILHGRYYAFQQIQSYKIEQIVRWHELYGLDERVNNAFKLTIQLKRSFVNSQFVVVEEREHLEKVISLLQAHGIQGEEIQPIEAIAENK